MHVALEKKKLLKNLTSSKRGRTTPWTTASAVLQRQPQACDAEVAAGRDVKQQHCKAATSHPSFQKHTSRVTAKGEDRYTPPTLSSWPRAVFFSPLESIPLLNNDFLIKEFEAFPKFTWSNSSDYFFFLNWYYVLQVSHPVTS